MTDEQPEEYWRLPFCLAGSAPTSSWLRCFLPLSQDVEGRCVQGNDGAWTHTDELRYAYDFALPEGTAVLAARRGVVAATCGEFTVGGLSRALRARANFVAIRHSDGLYSRYHHLAHASILVHVGQHVARGQPIAASGNTGFSSGPHLHFDVVDSIPEETSILEVGSSVGAPTRTITNGSPPSVAAAFSPPLPDVTRPLSARLVLGSPANAASSLDPVTCAGAVVLLRRCDDVDFIDKVRRTSLTSPGLFIHLSFLL